MTIPNNLQGHIEKKISYRHLELDLIVDGLRVRAHCHSPGLVGPYLTVFEQKRDQLSSMVQLLYYSIEIQIN